MKKRAAPCAILKNPTCGNGEYVKPIKNVVNIGKKRKEMIETVEMKPGLDGGEDIHVNYEMPPTRKYFGGFGKGKLKRNWGYKPK